MRRRIILFALAGATALVGPITAASAEPSTDTQGCQTVASKFLNEDAPGHQGVMTAGTSAGGEGPCGFGDPPSGR